MADVSVPGSSFNNNTLQINDMEHPILVQLHLEKYGIDSEKASSSSNKISNNSNGTTTLTINLIREVIKDPNGKVLSHSSISKEFTTSIKPTVQGVYTLSLYNFGNLPVKIGGSIWLCPVFKSKLPS